MISIGRPRADNIFENCFFCGKEMYRPPSQRKRSKRAFCSRPCNLKTMNAELNPTRMNLATRSKLRNAHLGKGEGKSYTKFYGIHEHRFIAELKIGRKLKKEEVVHHIDGNKRNNDINNLQVLPSQAEHARLHFTKKVINE